MQLVFATNNQHKLEEVQAMVGTDIELKSLSDINCLEDIPETGETFEANASQKSQFIYNRYQLNCFADDSGLEVDSLNGEPGVYSARYGGTRDSESNLQLVLDKLGDSGMRTARFRTVISLILDGKEHLFEGVAEGEITKEKAGVKGFGYDPIFQPSGYDITFAEMTSEEKNSISHRAKAMHKLIEFLKAAR
ncbi:non-canonical purine NTP diphosphatase [Flavihumibacter sp. R14]|nr:non-canonical purine NTP diphosphatase [Flavihumibacter soli]